MVEYVLVTALTLLCFLGLAKLFGSALEGNLQRMLDRLSWPWP